MRKKILPYLKGFDKLSENKNKSLPNSLVIYYILTLIIFFVGKNRIVSKYHLDKGPSKDSGFHVLLTWVDTFAILFIIPLAVWAIWGSYRLFRKLNPQNQRLTTTFVMIGVVPVVGITSYILYWVFILTFYGFAP